MASTQAGKGDPEVLTEIPDELKKLAKYVMRGFYPIEHVLIVDLLVRNIIMKDDDLAELLKFDKKQLRIMLNKLKCDKLLRSTLRVETDADGKTSRNNYYFINYKVFVNVVKYKLDKMRQKIESRERESTSKALYKCVNCDKQYNEYDTRELIDFMTGEMKCTLCGSEVQEDETAAPEKDSFMQIALFNEQMRPLYDLLKVVEHVKLSQEVLEPTPKVGTDAARMNQSSSHRGPGGWSEGSRPSYDLYNHEVTINMDSESNKPKEKKAAKERPAWMAQSTVDGAIIETDTAEMTPQTKQTTLSKSRSQAQEEIMKALLVHERKSATQVRVPSGAGALSDNESDESASDDDFPDIGIRDNPGLFGKRRVMKERIEVRQVRQAVDEDDDDEEEEEEEEEVMVSVKGQMVAFSEVTEHHVAKMNPQEKEEYVKLAQEAYAAMHD